MYFLKKKCVYDPSMISIVWWKNEKNFSNLKSEKGKA